MNEPAKILVVDDSPTLRAIIRSELEEGGYEVVEATNGIEALTRATVSPAPALITLDIEMPKLNGFETCRRLRDPRYARFFTDNKDGRIPVIFVTSNDTLADRQQGFELGAADFITKPFERGELLEAVDSVLKPGERLRGMTALVVDDSALARSIVVETLEREGMSVIQAEDGVPAYELMCNRVAEIDIVITDLVMAEMGGEELCLKIRRELGTGLGLSIVREIVEMHRGEVEVVSEEGEGARFTLSFPQAPQGEADPAPSGDEAGGEPDLPQPAASIEIRGRKILLAEDNPLNAKVAGAVLARAGCSVTAVENGCLALEAARRERFDAVLMDMHMPEMDGLEATRQIRSDPQLRELPIIALTASGRDEDVRQCLEAGMNGYLKKPIDSNALFAALRKSFQEE